MIPNLEDQPERAEVSAKADAVPRAGSIGPRL